ncbi:PilZ domain-containing protein [bacterium]|nr:PilZ domain-containing protein [bacterium]
MTDKKEGSWEGRERRQSARVRAQVALQLGGLDESVPGESLTTESINVGAEGVYCQVSHFIAPLTRLQLTMVLPIRDKKGQTRNEVLKTDGVIVRCQPAGSEDGGYRIACFFTGLEPAAREILQDYVRQHDTPA